uniref:DUF6598 domain-containing protein n=1 Tax=Leersia perrieri TaxID=77586 RepID=A0A0D9X442_9ORYZ
MLGCQVGERASTDGTGKQCATDVNKSDLAAMKRKPRKRELTWEEKVVKVLHMVLRREITEYNHKMFCSAPTRFCDYNIAFFDLDKESDLEPGPPVKSLTFSECWWHIDSINVIAIKVVESDVGYPISIFGTVLARDEYDFRCVYLFRRDRNNPQIITSPEDTLTLTGPNRALGAIDRMYFEFHLKIKGNGGVDKVFSKGLQEHNAISYTRKPMTLSLESWLSTIDLVYSPVQFAVEASVAINIKGVLSSKFAGKVTAWSTGDDENEIVLYDSEVEGTNKVLGAGGSVDLTRRFVAVKLDDALVLNVCVFEGDHETQIFEVVLGHNDEECIRKQGPYELQVKVVWTAALENRRRPMWKGIGDFRVLW